MIPTLATSPLLACIYVACLLGPFLAAILAAALTNHPATKPQRGDSKDDGSNHPRD